MKSQFKLFKIFATILMLVSTSPPIFAKEKNPSFNDAEYQLISRSTLDSDSNLEELIFKRKVNDAQIDGTTNEEYEYFIAEKPKGRNSVTENISDISYALNAKITYNYTSVGSFTRMSSIQVSNITVERGCTFKSVVVYLCNNGQGEKYLYTNQYKSNTFTTTSGGIIYGNSSWIPATTVEKNYSQGTGYMVTFTIKRGT